MNNRADARGDGLVGGRVLVAGSINEDLVLSSPRHPHVGETVIGEAMTRHPGGKGSNQAVAAAASDVPTEFIGAVGDDEAGARLRAFLEERGVGVDHLRSIPGVDSGFALIVVAGGDNAVVVISGANARLGTEALAEVSVEGGDVLLSQFEVSEEVVGRFFEEGKAAGAHTVLNTSPYRPVSRALLALSDTVVVNEIELRHLGEDRGLSGPIERLLAELTRELREGQALVATLGADGCVVATSEQTVPIPGRRVPVVDTTGAGDCFVGFMAGRLVRGDDLISAANLANVAASLCVQRLGAGSSMPVAAEVAEASRADFG